MKIEIPLAIDDMPISPEAFRVYVAIARSVAEHQEFPSVRAITARCFGKKYALGSTHTDIALKELIKLKLINCEGEIYSLSDDWMLEGVA